MFTPASRQMSICCRAAFTSRWPTGLAHPVPPKPVVPRVGVHRHADPLVSMLEPAELAALLRR